MRKFFIDFCFGSLTFYETIMGLLKDIKDEQIITQSATEYKILTERAKNCICAFIFYWKSISYYFINRNF